jgi:hypothetical protein
MKNERSSEQLNERNQQQERNSNSQQQNTSANRGKIDMDSESLGGASRSTNERGSGLTTKKTVTGSDLDGQAE